MKLAAHTHTQKITCIRIAPAAMKNPNVFLNVNNVYFLSYLSAPGNVHARPLYARRVWGWVGMEVGFYLTVCVCVCVCSWLCVQRRNCKQKANTESYTHMHVAHNKCVHTRAYVFRSGIVYNMFKLTECGWLVEEYIEEYKESVICSSIWK